MKRFEGFTYNKFIDKNYKVNGVGEVQEYHYIKDCKYGRKVELVEEYYLESSIEEFKTQPTYSASYYTKISKKGKHEWRLLCWGYPLDETINMLNGKINNWIHFNK